LCVRLAEEKQRPESSGENSLFSSEDWRRIKRPEKFLPNLSQSLALQYQHALGGLAFAAGARRQNHCKMHNKNRILGRLQQPGGAYRNNLDRAALVNAPSEHTAFKRAPQTFRVATFLSDLPVSQVPKQF